MHYAALLVSLAVTTALWGQSENTYRITHTYELGGAGGRDYVVPDSHSHRIFIARQTLVMVVDENSGKLLGEVADVHGVHVTAVAAQTGHGFATSSDDKAAGGRPSVVPGTFTMMVIEL